MADPISTLLNVVALITKAIELDKELRRLIQNYRNAEESSKSFEVFGLNLNAHRLNYIKRFIEEQPQKRTLNPRAEQDLSDAVQRLNKKLENSKKYFEEHAPNSSTYRAWWALRAQDKLIKLQEDVQEHLDTISGFVLLVCTTSSQLNKPPQPLEQPYFEPIKRRILDGSSENSATWVEAHYSPEDASFMRGYNPDVHVLSEKVPKEHSRKGGYKDAKQIATDLRKISNANSYARYHNGLLPCIGYTPRHHLVCLLPRNMSLKWRPRSLQRAIVDTKDNDPTSIVTLDMRFNIALQLARALKAIHSAGFSNCSIRSDEILFVVAEPDEPEGPDLAQDANNTVRQGEPFAPDTQKTPVKQGVFRRFTERFKTPKEPGGQLFKSTTSKFNQKEKSSVKGYEAEKDTPKAKKSLLQRETSMSSMRNLDKKRIDKSKSAPQPASLLTVPLGAIPPGASVFLAHWQDMRDHTAGAMKMDVNWYQDVYRHPKQQGRTSTRFSTGHDVYALGVCLLEVGLWDALVWRDDGTGSHCVSKVLASKLQLDATDDVPKALTSKPQLDATHDVPKALKDKLWTRKGPQEVRSALVKIAASELPKVMGKEYTMVVQACLECMDGDWQKYWSVNMHQPVWGEGHVEYQRQVCEALDVVIISMLSRLSAGISAK